MRLHPDSLGKCPGNSLDAKNPALCGTGFLVCGMVMKHPAGRNTVLIPLAKHWFH